MIPFKHVLIAVDFSKTTEPLLDCAEELRSLGTSTLTLVHVQEIGYPAGPPVTHEEAYRQRLETYAARLREEGFVVTTEIRAGSPGYEIAAAAVDAAADLILLAAHDHGVIKRTVMGSVAADVLRHASVPVLLDRFEANGEASADEGELRCSKKFSRVLVATDGSDPALPAEELAAVLSERADRTMVLTVVEENEDEAEYASALAAAGDRFGSRATTRLAKGAKASVEIDRVSREEDATVIIFGKQGRGYLADRFLGSTAENVARRTRRPVLVVPERHDTRALEARGHDASQKE